MEDQAWFLHTWRQDATIQSMLVMLDAIQERFDGADVDEADVDAAWSGLPRGGASTVTFHLLPMEEPGTHEDLYSELDRLGQRWLTEREAEGRLDWRYYLVKYDAMREGRSGLYDSSSRGDSSAWTAVGSGGTPVAS